MIENIASDTEIYGTKLKSEGKKALVYNSKKIVFNKTY